jgi:hypothetical protein
LLIKVPIFVGRYRSLFVYEVAFCAAALDGNYPKLYFFIRKLFSETSLVLSSKVICMLFKIIGKVRKDLDELKKFYEFLVTNFQRDEKNNILNSEGNINSYNSVELSLACFEEIIAIFLAEPEKQIPVNKKSFANQNFLSSVSIYKYARELFPNDYFSIKLYKKFIKRCSISAFYYQMDQLFYDVKELLKISEKVADKDKQRVLNLLIQVSFQATDLLKTKYYFKKLLKYKLKPDELSNGIWKHLRSLSSK